MKKNLFILFILYSFTLFAQQSKIDSLLQVLKISKEDTVKVILLNDICVIYKDAAEYSTALQYANQVLNLAKKLAYGRGIANAYNNLGLIWYEQSEYSKALEYFINSLTEQKKNGNKRGMARAHTNIGNIYEGQGNYFEAMNHY